MRFSANLGFLWADLPLPDAIRAAHTAGFDAVECHWPYDHPPGSVIAALQESGLPMLGINTRRGVGGEPEFGLAAIPGREADARAHIDEAVSYAAAIGAHNVHVMAGAAAGEAAQAVFLSNLAYACDRARPHGITILIEPLNRYDAPGYFLNRTGQALALMDRVGAANLKLMFDCYHVQRTEGDLSTRLRALLPRIGHIQFAAVPDRGPPDHGEVDYGYLFRYLDSLGYARPLGAEYRPGGPTGQSLQWLHRLRRP